MHYDPEYLQLHCETFLHTWKSMSILQLIVVRSVLNKHIILFINLVQIFYILLNILSYLLLKRTYENNSLWWGMSIPISLPTFAYIVRIYFYLSTNLELLYLPTELNCLLKMSLFLTMLCILNSILSDIIITLPASYFFIFMLSNFP